MPAADKALKVIEELIKRGRNPSVYQGRNPFTSKVIPGGGAYQGRTPFPGGPGATGLRGSAQGDIYQGRSPFTGDVTPGGGIYQGHTPLTPTGPRMGPYGPDRLRNRTMANGGSSLDAIRDALLGIDPSLAGGVKGAAQSAIPTSRSLVRLPTQVPPSSRFLGPGAGTAGLGAVGLASSLRGDTPPPEAITQPVSNASAFNATGIPSRLEGPITRSVPNAPVYNTAGIPPNLISPRDDPRTAPPEIAGDIPLPRGRPSIPLPRSHPAKLAARLTATPSEENQSILSALFGGAVDRYGRRFEPAPYAIGF